MKTDRFSSSIAGASIIISVIGLISKGIGFFREILFAGYFGLSKSFDLYLVGAVIPLAFNTIFLYVSQNYFIPNFISQKKQNKGNEFLIQTLIIFFIIGILLSLTLYIFSKPILSTYFNSQSEISYKIVEDIFKIYLVTIPFSTLNSILVSYLQAEYNFKISGFSHLIVNIAVIFLVIVFHNSIGVLAIPIGYLIGIGLQTVFLTYKCRYNFNWIIKIKYSDFLISIPPTIFVIVLIEAASQLYLLSDRYFFNSLQPGSIAALNYSFIIFLLPITIISISLSTALFPKFSDPIKNETENPLNNFFSINSFIFVPLSFLFYFYPIPIVKLLFERGEFTSADTYVTANLLKVYGIGLFFYSAYAVLNKLMYSFNLLRHLSVITLLGISLKIGFNFILVDRYKEFGLALSTSLSFIFFFCSSLVVLKNKIPSYAFLLKDFATNLLNGLVSYLVVSLIFKSLFESSILVLAIEIVIFLSIFFINAALIKQKPIKVIQSLIAKVI